MKKKSVAVISLCVVIAIFSYSFCMKADGKSVHKEIPLDTENIAIDANSKDVPNNNELESDSLDKLEPIVWYSDLTHDGIDEKIVVDLTYDINNPIGPEQTVSVYSGSTGSLIWTDYADIVHPTWNGIYIYNDGENEYLLNWKPVIYHDIADFYFHVFSLTDEGEMTENTMETINFNMLRPKECDTDEISTYINKVNDFLKNSYVLIDTDNGTPVYSKENDKIDNLYDASFIFYMIEDMKEEAKGVE